MRSSRSRLCCRLTVPGRERLRDCRWLLLECTTSSLPRVLGKSVIWFRFAFTGSVWSSWFLPKQRVAGSLGKARSGKCRSRGIARHDPIFRNLYGNCALKKLYSQYQVVGAFKSQQHSFDSPQRPFLDAHRPPYFQIRPRHHPLAGVNRRSNGLHFLGFNWKRRLSGSDNKNDTGCGENGDAVSRRKTAK